MDKGLVLSDQLQIEYYKFKHHEEYDEELIKKLLNYYKDGFLTNTAQLERTKIIFPINTRVALQKSGYTKQTLKELAEKTIYKVILTTDKSEFPYININGDKIENYFSGTFYRNESRIKAIEHIKALCDKAKEIFIYDNYFSGTESPSNIETLKKILPQRQIKILFPADKISNDDILSLNSTCSKWMFQPVPETKTHHDRYILIDNHTEIILTSGFHHLSNTIKECTYIVKRITENHLI